MNTVKVKVFGAGSLEVEGMDPKALIAFLQHCLVDQFPDGKGPKVREIKRGPRPKVKEDANVNAN